MWVFRYNENTCEVGYYISDDIRDFQVIYTITDLKNSDGDLVLTARELAAQKVHYLNGGN